MLEEVKRRLQITGDYMDDMLEGWIESCQRYLHGAGADEAQCKGENAYGVITKGVFDMWTRDSFSEMFLNMATQFALDYPAGVDCAIATNQQVIDLFDEADGDGQ